MAQLMVFLVLVADGLCVIPTAWRGVGRKVAFAIPRHFALAVT